MSEARTRRALVLGVGNLLWADEGFGVRCVEAFARQWVAEESIVVLDGGTQGLALVPQVAAATHVIVFDAVDFGRAPGSLVVARDAEVLGWIGADRMSLHQAGLADVLACVELMGRAPQRLTLIGVQPIELEDYGGSLRPGVRAQLEPALAIAAAELSAWGFTLSRAESAGTDASPTWGAPSAQRGVALPDAAIALDRYEQGRPSAELACRVGDPRVLARATDGAP